MKDELKAWPDHELACDIIKNNPVFSLASILTLTILKSDWAYLLFMDVEYYLLV